MVLTADMEKVETLPPADFQFKISAYWENQSPLVECKNFRQFSENYQKGKEHCLKEDDLDQKVIRPLQ